MTMTRVADDVEHALELLRRDQRDPVRAKVGDLTVELRVVPGANAGRTMEEVLDAIGPWAGDHGDEIAAVLAEGRKWSGSRPVGDL